MSVGDPVLDSQHQQIFEAIKKLSEFYPNPDPNKVFSENIELVTQLMTDHMDFEEQYLRDHNYPDLEQHAARHQSLMDEYTELLYQLTRGIEGIEQELIDFLCSWWISRDSRGFPLQEHLQSV